MAVEGRFSFYTRVKTKHSMRERFHVVLWRGKCLQRGERIYIQTDNGWPEVSLFIFPLACVVEASEDLGLFHLSLANTGGGWLSQAQSLFLLIMSWQHKERENGTPAGMVANTLKAH